MMKLINVKFGDGTFRVQWFCQIVSGRVRYLYWLENFRKSLNQAYEDKIKN